MTPFKFYSEFNETADDDPPSVTLAQSLAKLVRLTGVDCTVDVDREPDHHPLVTLTLSRRPGLTDAHVEAVYDAVGDVLHEVEPYVITFLS